MKLTISEGINNDFDFSELDKAVEKLNNDEIKYFKIEYRDKYNDWNISILGDKMGHPDRISYLLTLSNDITQTITNLNTLKYKIEKYIYLNNANIHNPIELANVYYDQRKMMKNG